MCGEGELHEWEEALGVCEGYTVNDVEKLGRGHLLTSYLCT